MVQSVNVNRNYRMFKHCLCSACTYVFCCHIRTVIYWSKTFARFFSHPWTLMKSHTRKKILLTQLLFVGITLLISVAAYAQPVASFSCSNVSGCAPILVSFTDQSAGNPTEWKWDLGNGTVSHLQNPSVTYFTPGSYTVKLVIKSGTMEDSVVKVNQVTVYGGPAIQFTASATTGCNELSTVFTDQSSTAYGTLSEWKWDFGDGVLSDVRNPDHRYDQPGDFNITLNVKNSFGCSSSLLKTAYIKVNNIKAGFNMAKGARCTPNGLNFTNTTTGNGVIQYKWDFGNGDTSSVKSQWYTYANGGNYTVKLIARNQFGCVDSVIKNIVVDTPVSAAFTADNTKGCKAPFTVHFTNQQLSGNTYSWTMGDSSKSNASNPVHEYVDADSFTVKLVVRNVNGCVDSVTKTDYIIVKAATIKPLNLPDSGCTGFTKTIRAELNPLDSVLSIRWKFADGTTSSLLSPSHNFAGDGYQNVTVTTATLAGCIDTFIVKNAIKVSKRPHADFTADVTNDCAYTKIHFTNLSTGTVTKWNWEFNNTDMLYDKDPVYTFRDTGFVPVQLVAKNGGCADTVRKEKLIYLKPSVAKPKYTLGCSDASTLFFKNNSLGADKWAWNFGDGVTSTELNPVHTYAAAGTYSMSLETWNNTTGCYYLQTLPVTVAKRNVTFYASDTVICKKNTISFTANIDTAVTGQLVWEFGDGSKEVSRMGLISHTYSRTGTFDVSLVVVNEGGCTDTIIKPGYIRVNGPVAKAQAVVAESCFDKPVLFKDSSLTDGVNSIQQWVWNFGDGKTDSLYAPPFQHTYGKRGNYTVSLKITDASGCSDSVKLTKPVSIIRPEAYILIYDTLTCTGKPASMTAPYADAGITYRWSFGDGDAVGARQSAAHSYAAEGLYSVKLVINDQLHGCADSAVKVNAIRVQDPVPMFSMSDSFKACPPLLVEFKNESLNAVDELWDFGDGSSTATHTPAHYYSYPGIYTVTLTVKGTGGCNRQLQRKVVVNGPKGEISFDPFNICTQRTVNFRVKSTEVISYTWDFNDGTVVNNTDTFMAHSYTNAGGYMPKLILMNDKGCQVPVTGKDSVQIRTAFKMVIDKPGKVCAGQSKKLQASGAASYQWSPAVGLDNAAIATPVARPANSTIYKVIGTDDKGCYTDTGLVSVDIAPLPVVDAGADKKITAGTPLDLVPSVSADVTEVRWSPTGAIFRNSESAVTVKPLETTEYTVQVANAAGCVASDRVNVIVTKANGEFFVPNTFSPNGDGMNDVFYPRSAVTVRITSLKIMNRFGAVVFERSGFNSNDANAGWDGSSRGNKLLPDVYIYVMSILNADNKPQVVQGDVALIR